jgi:transcriptional regulator with XRE-family HTH domain
MARPRRIVKNELSAAIVELRRRLGHSQQSFANLLGLSLGAVARWELNQRPQRAMLKRLIQLAPKDLADIFYLEYRREFGLDYDIAFDAEAAAALEAALGLVDLLPEPERPEDRQRKIWLKKILESLREKSVGLGSGDSGCAVRHRDATDAAHAGG